MRFLDLEKLRLREVTEDSAVYAACKLFLPLLSFNLSSLFMPTVHFIDFSRNHSPGFPWSWNHFLSAILQSLLTAVPTAFYKIIKHLIMYLIEMI